MKSHVLSIALVVCLRILAKTARFFGKMSPRLVQPACGRKAMSKRLTCCSSYEHPRVPQDHPSRRFWRRSTQPGGAEEAERARRAGSENQLVINIWRSTLKAHFLVPSSFRSTHIGVDRKFRAASFVGIEVACLGSWKDLMSSLAERRRPRQCIVYRRAPILSKEVLLF